MPLEARCDSLYGLTDSRPVDALFHSFAAAEARHDLTITVHGNEAPAVENRLSVFQWSRDELLNERFTSPELPLRLGEINWSAHDFNAATCGAHRQLNDSWEIDCIFDRRHIRDDSRPRLWYAKFSKEACESRLIQRGPVRLEGRQRKANAWRDALGKSSKDKSLFVNRQQDIEPTCAEQVEYELQITIRIDPDTWTAVNGVHKGRKTGDAVCIGITDFDGVAAKAKGRNGLPSRSAGAFGQKNMEASIGPARHAEHRSKLGMRTACDG